MTPNIQEYLSLRVKNLIFFVASDENCIEYPTAAKGWFSAPDDDGNGIYNTLANCWWIIEAPRDKVIRLEFIELDITCGDKVVVR